MLNFVIALPAEAKPIIKRFQLKRRSPDMGFPVYQGNEVWLVVSGPGKTAAAAAAAHLHALSGFKSSSVWLNIGVAGQGGRPLGEGILAHRITDRAGGRSWYPPLVFEPPCPTESLLTVDQPQTDYAPGTAYDMEASGFYATACRFSTGELIHCYKVISDNHTSSARKLSGPAVMGYIGERLPEIERLAEILGQLASTLAADVSADLARFLEHWHFTESQRHQLKHLINRWRALSSAAPWRNELRKLPSARQVLKHLSEEVETLPVRLCR